MKRLFLITFVSKPWSAAWVAMLALSTPAPAGPPATEAAAPPRHSYNEPYRPQFHFTYRRGWLSDPNELVFYKGEYHLMSQHCLGTDLNYPATYWGHAVSTDLVHWTEMPPAQAPEADGGMFSGSVVVDWNNVSGLQSGEEKVLLLFYTGARFLLPDNRPGVICLAYSNDKGRTWTKYAKNPVVEPIAHHNGDPKNTLWVFWAGRGYYQVGAFDGKTFKPEGPVRTANQPAGHRIPAPYIPGDQALVASQIWSDIPPSDGRTIQIAWMHKGVNAYPDMPFNQQASFPCVLTLRQFSDGIKLCRQPVREIENLHATKHLRRNQTLEPGKNPLAGVPLALLPVRSGNKAYVKSAGKMADFFIRTQTQSQKHTELDGTWYRGFDFQKWDYWGSDGDLGWGVWTNEIGWTHSWITATLELREMKTSLWDIASKVDVAPYFDRYRKLMLPDDVLKRSGQN